MGFWKTFWACLLAIVTSSLIGMLFSFLVFFGIIVSIIASAEPKVKVDEKTVLVLDLEDPIVESMSNNLASYLDWNTFEFDMPYTLYGLTSTIEKAAIDPKVEGIYLKIPFAVASSTSKLYELRESLSKFKRDAPNKFIVAYGDAYSQEALYLSSVADEVFLNPAGAVSWQGMSVSPMFYKKALEKLGIQPQIIRHGKFKGAVEPFILDKLSAENREQYQSLINSDWNYIVETIADSRQLSAEKLNAAATDLSVQTAEDAKKFGLVDRLMYFDQFEDFLEDRIGDDPEYMSFSDYSLSSIENFMQLPSKNEIALIYATGEIVDEGEESDKIIGHDLAAKIADANDDDDVKAIVVRVNSPGGSALASEVIYREMSLAVKEKPVIISMGDYAASGGYWISCPATKIVSTPVTVTGSIGVFGLLFNVQKGAENILGITVDPVKTNPSADLGMPFRSLTPLEYQVLQSGVDTVYNEFLGRVSKGRDMSKEKVDEIGQGRIWSGLLGEKIGLVDEIGTLNDAIALAAREANIEGDYTVKQKLTEADDLFGMIMQSSVSVMSDIVPSVFTSTQEKILTQLKGEQGKVQAILPFELIK